MEDINEQQEYREGIENSENAETQEPKEKSTPMRTISNILSAVFSPLLVPTYAYSMALWISYLAIVPEKTRFLTCLMIFFITAIVPLGTIIFLIKKGKVSDAAISKSSERAIPYTVTTLCYFIAAAYLWAAPKWLFMFFVGAGIAAIVDVLINIKWKISAHATSMGGLCALVFFIGYNHIAIVPILPWIAVVIFLSGAVGTARIYLKRHTPAQVYVGWLTGFAVSFVAMMLSLRLF